ncbi:hypothetical protein Y032_0039g133 [Ancylostoma ceylanicum]|uniref:Uncharacterized protein n=1 Tax=Ancylostoma ceylanicum TaxID=53326 RepID=A0A016UIN3_9BILA|nr:hypothetical protein Y032_0039g133 [Ancylostoma ceylanicum]
MARATETAEIILEHMPSLKRSSCSLIEEGPPYPPVPAVDHWKPQYSSTFKLELVFLEGFALEQLASKQIFERSGLLVQFFLGNPPNLQRGFRCSDGAERTKDALSKILVVFYER